LADEDKMKRDYSFDGSMSREVLENYLSRANNPSPAVPGGFGQEDTIREIWASC